jgi:hypothetical protein
MRQHPISRQSKKEKTKPLRDSIVGKLHKDLLGGNEGGHRLLGWAVACHQVLVEAQWLLRRKPVDLGEVTPSPPASSTIAKETPVPRRTPLSMVAVTRWCVAQSRSSLVPGATPR